MLSPGLEGNGWIHPSVCPRLIPFAYRLARCGKAQVFGGPAVQGRPWGPCPVLVAPQQALPEHGLTDRSAGQGRCCGNAISQHSVSLQRAGRDGQSLCSMAVLQPLHGSGMPAAPPWLAGTPPCRWAPCASHGEGSWGPPGVAWPAARRGCGRREARGLGSACEPD